MSTSPRETFDRRKKELLDEVLVLASMVEESVLESVAALRKRDLKTSERILKADEKINQKRYANEAEALILMATQQPMARDLRFLAAILEINTELERMGDYAKGISRVNLMLGEGDVNIPGAELQLMAEQGLSMLRRALDSFINEDAETARAIPKEDDEIDNLYNRIYHESISEVIRDPSKVDQANYITWAAHNLERLADRVTNICERIIFVITGSMRELDRSDDESIFYKQN